MKFLKLFRKAFDQSAALAGLDQRFEDAAKLSDPAERLLKYRTLAGESGALREKVKDKGVAVVVPFALCALGLFVAGMGMVIPLFIGVGAAATFVTMLAVSSLGKDAMDAAASLYNRSNAAIDGILNDPPMAGLAASPHFDRVMQEFPPLKEKFLLAMSKQKFAAPAAGAPAEDLSLDAAINVNRPLTLKSRR